MVRHSMGRRLSNPADSVLANVRARSRGDERKRRPLVLCVFSTGCWRVRLNSQLDGVHGWARADGECTRSTRCRRSSRLPCNGRYERATVLCHAWRPMGSWRFFKQEVAGPGPERLAIHQEMARTLRSIRERAHRPVTVRPRRHARAARWARIHRAHRGSPRNADHARRDPQTESGLNLHRGQFLTARGRGRRI